MGGFGSGNHWKRWNKKTVVEDCLVLDSNRWQREGYLKAEIRVAGGWTWTYRSGHQSSIGFEIDTLQHTSPTVRLKYVWRPLSEKDRDSLDYLVRLTTTCPHYGGLRWWFLCPLIVNGRPCRRRVAKTTSLRGGAILVAETATD